MTSHQTTALAIRERPEPGAGSVLRNRAHRLSELATQLERRGQPDGRRAELLGAAVREIRAAADAVALLDLDAPGPSPDYYLG